MRMQRRWTTTTGYRFHQTILATRCVASGSSAEEEDGYYNGFANEGLWPLCHIAHTRPTFRTSDWEYYNKVNKKFADALVEEIGGEEHPVVLIQDYHFALLPRMLKETIASRKSCHLLAYSLAQSGIIQHLPVAAGAAGRPAGCGPDRFSHPGAL